MPVNDSFMLLIEPQHIKNKITSFNMGMTNHTFSLLAIINIMYI